MAEWFPHAREHRRWIDSATEEQLGRIVPTKNLFGKASPPAVATPRSSPKNSRKLLPASCLKASVRRYALNGRKGSLREGVTRSHRARGGAQRGFRSCTLIACGR
jgi:hypothetical protein